MGIVSAFVERLAPGSVVAVSHVCSTGANPDAIARVEEIDRDATSPGVCRTHEQITGLFGPRMRSITATTIRRRHARRLRSPNTGVE
jgi:hypothetical protein